MGPLVGAVIKIATIAAPKVIEIVATKVFQPKPTTGQKITDASIKVATSVAIAAGTALVVDAVKGQRARQNETSDSNGPAKDH